MWRKRKLGINSEEQTTEKNKHFHCSYFVFSYLKTYSRQKGIAQRFSSMPEKQRIPFPQRCLACRGWSLIAALALNVGAQESTGKPPTIWDGELTNTSSWEEYIPLAVVALDTMP